jgi:hypothetical protein
MFKHQVRSLIGKSALLAAIIAVAPALHGQNVRTILPGSAAFDALPAAVSPAISAGSTVSASYSAQTFSTIRIPDAPSTNPGRKINVENLPSRRNWLLLSAASSGAAALDAYSTRRSVAAGNVEANPIMRPFAGSPAIYVALQASPLVMDYAALKMQHSRNPVIRHLWWVPQTSGTAMSLFAGVHNLSIASR